jgi:hypothetical protein
VNEHRQELLRAQSGLLVAGSNYCKCSIIATLLVLSTCARALHLPVEKLATKANVSATHHNNIRRKCRDQNLIQALMPKHFAPDNPA